MEKLYSEYRNSLKIQNEIIRSNLEQLRTAKSNFNYKEVRRLSSILRILYDEKRELEEKSLLLRDYLDKTKH